MYKPNAACIYLNRNCPRNCSYCAVKDLKKDDIKLSPDSWIECFEILRHLGVDFFLILGAEPLLLEQNLIKLVEYWSREDIEYGFYSTAPRILFMRRAPSLIQAGLRNWSCGIDFVPEVYNARQYTLSPTCKRLVEGQKESLVAKAKDSFFALKYMQGKVPELHAMPTISRMNIEFMPEMIMWLVDNFDKSLHMALNFVERSKDPSMDFAIKKESRFFFTEEDRPLLENFAARMDYLPDIYKERVQTSFDYLNNIDHIINLDWHCDINSMAISIDCDGSIRQCGYKNLNSTQKYYYWDLADKLEEVFAAIEESHSACSGCYWSYPYALGKYGNAIVNYRSELWKERDKL